MDGSTPPERVELAGRGAVRPSTTRGRDRLAFVRNVWDVDLYRVTLGSSPEPQVRSTFNETHPRYSPDGKRIAVESGRSGTPEVWLAEAAATSPLPGSRRP